MVYINISQNNDSIILDCHKNSKNGDFFQLIIDKKTKELIQKPSEPDIDASTAYSHVYFMLKNGETLPQETVAAWG